MSDNSDSEKKVWGLMSKEWKIAFAIGWQDVIMGNGFHAVYDGLDKKRQYAYEQGRLWAANVIAAGMKPTVYKDIRGNKEPEEQARMRSASMRIGAPIR